MVCRLVWLLGIAVMGFPFLAGAQEIRADTIQSGVPDTLVVGVEADYPPFSMVNARGDADGFAIELFRETARKIGREVIFRTAPWKTLVDQLQNGTIHAIPFVVRNVARENLFDLTVPYLRGHAGVFMREGSDPVRNITDLAGKEIIVLEGGFIHSFLNESISAKFFTVTSVAEGLKLLAVGKHDAMVTQRLVAVGVMNREGIRGLVNLDLPVPGFNQSYCFATADGNQALCTLLNEGLTLSISDGTHQRLLGKWFGSNDKIDFKRTRIWVGGDSDFPPFEFLGPNGEPAGFNVEVMRAIARAEDMAIDIQLGPRADLGTALTDDRVDVVMGMYYSDKADLNFDFSRNHNMVSQVVIFRKTDPEPSRMADLAGKSILVAAGDAQAQDFAQQAGHGIPVTVKTQQDALRQLAEGEADYAIVALPLAKYYLKSLRLRDLRISDQCRIEQEYCFAALDGRPDILAKLESGLEKIRNSGEYLGIYEKWLAKWDENHFSWRQFFRYSLYILIPMVALLVAALLWSRMLKREVTRRTEKLAETNLLLEAARKKAEESDRLKSSFLANMSHEIRTPMNGILGFAELLEDPQLTGDEQRKYLGIIQQSGERMLALINDLIDISKIEAGQVTLNIREVFPSTLMADLYAFFLPECQKKGLELVLEQEEGNDHVIIRTDQGKINQVMTNLIKNAIKFTAQGRITYGYRCHSDTVEFFVKDTGIGIAPENQTRIFDRFIREQGRHGGEIEGTGLGLSISRAYVELLGGHVSVSSEPGKGSKFSFELPK